MYRTLILRSQQLFEIFVLDAAKSVIGNYLVPGEFSQPFHFLQISHVKNNYFSILIYLAHCYDHQVCSDLFIAELVCCFESSFRPRNKLWTLSFKHF